MARVFILALDGMPFEVFERLGDELPNIGEVADSGSWGVMRAVDPPITVPAWASMFTGRDPGELGIYGFRHMRRGSYEGYVVTSRDLGEQYVWERRGLRSVVVGLPPGYPPREYGVWISDFLTPRGRPWAYPPGVMEMFPGYVFDVEYRTDRKEEAFKALVEMVELRFAVAERLVEAVGWDVFVLHEIGTDRVHHLFQKFWDPEHPLYTPGNPHEDKIPRLYRLVDELFGRLRKRLPRDVEFLVISDHGNQAQRGVLALNELLAEWGLLSFKSEPSRGADVESVVDWGRTKVVAWGGYYARLFFNTVDRPQGVVSREEADDLKRELRRRLRSLKAPWGYILNAVYEPGELYRSVRGDFPDLMVYFDSVRVRPVQTVGYGSPWLEGNDRGPDDSLHSFNGFYAATWGDARKRDMHALDVARFLESVL
ncbi:type I phosphodiesterase/nucleotide pyrophosphatase [Thermoproteus uzoniensis 768-20]|uniref:Type I phosphodiesterase/nucleotide pyrophosphatase n=1 Tax=Thermoproteus uzoniensis (strain 768-20) TaxID=999630 RepID=F2L0N3_THEU7|nr:alkaline phosphatase family protein [Thermoproteus uzoniensis]AEA11512.1 type I phosphodiesterase/nucleotide pyrophosphatase [Thermoproteus uzoniensis 768-20]